MATGIILIDKPQGWTSHDVTARLRRVYNTRRIGHGGTLDPMATGVLPVFVGRATRAVEFLEQAQKEYVATVRLGVVTDTQDTSGTVLETHEVSVTDDQVKAALSAFLGPQMQVPPMYSAIKIDGKKLYQLARKGKEIERPARPIEILEIELLECRTPEYVFRVRCSKGTYVRSICHDLGKALGCGGAMSALRRTGAGAYTIDKTVPLEDLLSMSERGEEVEHFLLPVDSVFAQYPSLSLTSKQEKQVRNGGGFSTTEAPGMYRLYAGTEFLALGNCAEGKMASVKSFFEVN